MVKGLGGDVNAILHAVPYASEPGLNRHENASEAGMSFRFLHHTIHDGGNAWNVAGVVLRIIKAIRKVINGFLFGRGGGWC